MSTWGEWCQILTETDHDNAREVAAFQSRLSPPTSPAQAECPYAAGAGLDLPDTPQHASFRGCGPVVVTDLTEMDAAELERVDLSEFEESTAGMTHA